MVADGCRERPRIPAKQRVWWLCNRAICLVFVAAGKDKPDQSWPPHRSSRRSQIAGQCVCPVLRKCRQMVQVARARSRCRSQGRARRRQTTAGDCGRSCRTSAQVRTAKEPVSGRGAL